MIFTYEYRYSLEKTFTDTLDTEDFENVEVLGSSIVYSTPHNGEIPVGATCNNDYHDRVTVWLEEKEKGNMVCFEIERGRG